MSTMIVDSTMSNLQTTSPPQDARPVLRRATYVHVSDLTNAYNIDHAMLEQELARVKAERELGTDTEPPKAIDLEDESTAAVSELDPASSTNSQKRLQPPRGGYNLCVLVGKVTLVVDKKRVDQSRVRLAEVEIGDETGTVSLRARDEQIDLLEEVSRCSGAVVLRNCTLELYQGKHIRLAVTKWGKLSVYPDKVASTPTSPSKMNTDRNFSAIDLSVVASEMADVQPETPYGGRQAKQSDTSDPGARPSHSKPGNQSYQKQQQPQSTGKKGGRDRRQSKGKQGASGHTSHPQYIPPSGDRASGASQPSPMRYTTLHPYPVYDQGMDLRQYHNPRPQDSLMAPASTQHWMMQRQYEMQQHQLHHMYHGQQERHRAGMSPSHHQVQPQNVMLQPGVPPGSFDTGDYHLSSYGSTTSSPILIPMPMPGSHGTSNVNPRGHSADPRQSDSSSTAHDNQATQYMSVSPDDSSQFSHMNPDAAAFAPTYLGAAQANPSATHHVYFPYDQPIYPSGMMYAPASRADSHSPSNQIDLRPTASSTQAQGATNAGQSGEENMKSA